MSDSPRWCGSCNRYGDHHTDRCPRAHPPDVTFTPGRRDRGNITWFSCAVCGAAVFHDANDDDESMLELHAEWHATAAFQKEARDA